MEERVSQNYFSRRRVQVVLGVLWLIDALMQLQPKMFGSDFIAKVIAPAAKGQPIFISGPQHFLMHLFLHQPLVFNLLIVLTQIAIGILIINKRSVKIGLVGAIAWGLFVWYIGEGLGRIFSGQASLAMGAPGAAILYALIALAVWPSKSDDERDRPAAWLAYVWAVVWLGGALLQMLNGQNTTAELTSMISAMANGAPGWLGAIDHYAASLLAHLGNWFIWVVMTVQALIGTMIFSSKSLRSAAVYAGIIVSAVFWVIGQGFGMFYSGSATDPGTAPLVILLGLCLLSSKRLDFSFT